MKALLLAGGHGTRLRPLTHTGNKHMIPIANRPLLFYALDNLRKVGIKEVGIIIGPLGERIPDAVGNGAAWNMNVTYIPQPEPKGIAHAILVARDFLEDEPFVYHLGDVLLKQGVGPIVKEFQETGSDCVIAMCRVKEPQRYGTVELKDGKIVKLTEKPRNPKSDLIVAGICVLNSCIHDVVASLPPSWRGELELCDAIQTLVDLGKNVGGHTIEGWWKDTGKPEDLLEANQLILQDLPTTIKGTIEDDVSVTGNIMLGEGSRVFGGSSLRGPLVIGNQSVIGPSAYVGPYTSIGDQATISNSEIENSIAMNGVVIKMGNGNRIVDSLIGANSQVILNNKIPSGRRVVIGESSRLEW